MRALLTQFIGGVKNGEQLSASTLTQTNEGAASAKGQSFTNLMTALLGTEKRPGLAEKGNLLVQTEETVPESIFTGESITIEKSKGKKNIAVAAPIAAVNTKIETDTPTTPGKEKIDQNQIKPTENAQKLTQQTVNVSAAENTFTPEKENALRTINAAESLVKGNKQSTISINPKGTIVENEDAFKRTAAAKNAAKKNAQSLKHASSTGDSSSKEKTKIVQNDLKPVLNKSDEKIQKTPVRQGKIIKSGEQFALKTEAKNRAVSPTIDVTKKASLGKTFTRASNQQDMVFVNSDRDVKQPKIVSKKEVNPAVGGKERKQSVPQFFRNAASNMDGKMKENLPKALTAEPSTNERSRAPLAKSRFMEHSGGTSLRTHSNLSKPVSGKINFPQSSTPVDAAMEMDARQDFKSLDKNIKEVQMNNLKAVHLADSGGRRTFGKQLAQVSRQQFSNQPQTTEWKHHRFVLKDGNAVNIAARTSSGALHLQLSVGPGELGKIIQQHLPDIQQHVQQELEIEIDLQLQDFGGGQANQQEDSVSQKQSSGITNAGENTLSGDLTDHADDRQIRYFGFNKNEWIA